MDAYLEALERSVTPGSVVVDLGCGPGVFAIHACHLGAKRVYAIEPQDVIQLARDVAVANGFGSRIEFIQAVSTEVELPERADVIIADLRGILPLWGTSLPSMIDGRERFLKPGGVMIPQRDILWATVIDAPETYARKVLPWDFALREFDTAVIREMSANSIYKIRSHPSEFLAEQCPIASIGYRTTTSSSCACEAMWRVSRSGNAHGIAVWFDTELAEGVGFSNAPGKPELLYGAAFFPFREPLAVAAGDHVSSQIRADLVGSDYVWRWKTTLNGEARSEQSTFFGMPVASASLRRKS